MNVETIILDEFDQLLDDSQIHFVEKITHYAPRDHQLVYMSATTKFDQKKIAPNTRTIDLSDQKIGQHPALLHAGRSTSPSGYATKTGSCGGFSRSGLL